MMHVLLNAKNVTFHYTKLFVMFHAVRPTYMNLVEVFHKAKLSALDTQCMRYVFLFRKSKRFGDFKVITTFKLYQSNRLNQLIDARFITFYKKY